MKLRLAILLPIYLATYSISYLIAFLLRFEFQLSEQYSALFFRTLPIVVGVKLFTNACTRDWKRKFRYTTASDIVNVSAGVVLAAAAVYLIDVAIISGKAIPRSIILIDAALTILAVGFLRTSVRFYRQHWRRMQSQVDRQGTLIYRSNQDCVGILRTLQISNGQFRPSGFLDPSPLCEQSVIAGAPVYDADQDWGALAARLDIRHVLIPSSVSGRAIRQIVKRCSDANLRAHIIPTVPELVDGRYKLSIRDVTVSDLLRRPATELDFESIREYISGKRVLVTGASGSIGSELCRQILDLQPDQLVLVDQSEFGVFEMQQELLQAHTDANLEFVVADITNEGSMRHRFEQFQPHLVFHAAAYKHVPLMQDNPLEAIHNNVLGTKVIVDLAGEFGAERFVFISTDKAVRPSNVMGATKLVAEKYVQAGAQKWDTQFISVRFGNVLNSAGSVVPTFRRQIETGGPITVTHPDMERFFMTIPEAVQLVLQAGAIGTSGDVMILEMGDPVKIVDLAKDMICLSGLNYPDDIDIVFSGMRPGEKLTEELFYASEDGTKKVHDKIFCSHRKPPHLLAIHDGVARLRATVDSYAPSTGTEVLWDVVDRLIENEDFGTEIKHAA